MVLLVPRTRTNTGNQHRGTYEHSRNSSSKLAVKPRSKATGSSARARVSRAAAIASANGHNAMEGLFPSTFSQDLQKRYMDGEIEIEEAVQAARRHYGLS